MIRRTKGREIILVPVLFTLFSLGGAVFGMGEEAIPFAMVIVPLTIAMGYDAVVAVCVTYGATQIGFGTSWMNPFGLAIAQGIAGVPVMSGTAFPHRHVGGLHAGRHRLHHGVCPQDQEESPALGGL